MNITTQFSLQNSHLCCKTFSIDNLFRGSGSNNFYIKSFKSNKLASLSISKCLSLRSTSALYAQKRLCFPLTIFLYCGSLSMAFLYLNGSCLKIASKRATPNAKTSVFYSSTMILLLLLLPLLSLILLLLLFPSVIAGCANCDELLFTRRRISGAECSRHLISQALRCASAED